MKIIKKKLRLEINKSLYLKILEEKDVSEKYVNWLNDYEINKYTEQKYFTNNYGSICEYVSKKFLSNNEFLFGIFYNKEHIGNIKLGPIKWNHMTSEVSFFIGDKNYWGKNITTHSLKKLIDFGLSELRLMKINASYYSNNKGSYKVFKNCGFEIEGVKKADIFFEGKRIDSIIVGYRKG